MGMKFGTYRAEKVICLACKEMPKYRHFLCKENRRHSKFKIDLNTETQVTACNQEAGASFKKTLGLV